MDRRTHEGPMDFEYQNGTGPMDGRSPFAQVSMNSRHNNNNNNNEKKRSWTKFESSSPTKPSLRDPAPNHPHFFSQPGPAYASLSPPKPLPALPLNKNPLFNTPRKLDVYDIESSGGETPKSPEHLRGLVNDSDATPDMGLRSRFAILDTSSKPEFKAGGAGAGDRTAQQQQEPQRPAVEKSNRRQSWWRSTVNRMSSPLGGGGGGSTSPTRKAPGDEYSHALEKKIMKKRRGQIALARRISISDDDDSANDDTPEKRTARAERRRNRSPSKQHRHDNNDSNNIAAEKPHWLYTFFGFLTAHPTLPTILSFYAQLVFNLFIIAMTMYVLWSFWATVRSDVDKKSNEVVAELMQEMAACAQQYTANRCDPETRVPAMQTVCDNWSKCMQQDPRNVGRARVSAHTFAEIFNGFIEPISYKAMFFTLALFFSGVTFSNLAFSVFRDKVNSAQQQQQQQQQNAQHHHYYGSGVGPAMLPPPPTPQRQISGGEGGGGGYWTPFPTVQGLEAPSHQQQQGEGEGSPVRRLQFR